MDSGKASKEELRQKLRDKINGKRNQRLPTGVADDNKKVPMTQKKYNKLLAEATKELTQLKTDDRVTPAMNELYENTCKTFSDIKVPTPSELLNNPELAKSKFKEYLVGLIDMCKQNNVPRETFISKYLNSLYTEYHVVTLGIDVVPEKLQKDLDLSYMKKQ